MVYTGVVPNKICCFVFGTSKTSRYQDKMTNLGETELQSITEHAGIVTENAD